MMCYRRYDKSGLRPFRIPGTEVSSTIYDRAS